MKVSVFQSGADPEVFGFTSDTDGKKLPADLQPWHKLSDNVQTRPANPVTGLPSSEHIADGVSRDGCYVSRSRSGAAMINQVKTARETEVEMVSRHVRNGTDQVRRQREVVARAIKHRYSLEMVTMAQALLAQCEELQQEHERHLARLTVKKPRPH